MYGRAHRAHRVRRTCIAHPLPLVDSVNSCSELSVEEQPKAESLLYVAGVCMNILVPVAHVFPYLDIMKFP